MMKKLSLLVGFGAGYVLGAKAGTERYDEIMSKVRELAGQPQVQQATAKAQDTASGIADKAKDTVNEKVSAATDKADSIKSGGSKNDSVVDLGTSTGTGTGANTGATAPMAGASASRTAPDVTRP